MPAVASIEVNSQMPIALLVDRDADTRRMYAEFLKGFAYAIDEAEDGREALAKALTRHHDIVITETRLGGINGIELCRLLRRDPATSELPIVFVTGDAFEDDTGRAKSAGADSVLVKPCLPETLMFEMRRLLSESKELRERARVARQNFQQQRDRSERLLSVSREHQRRLTLSRAHVRQQTTAPPEPPPALVCPACDQPLSYERSHIGGVNARSSEQWDYYECSSGCGTFQYRHRTRKLRRMT